MSNPTGQAASQVAVVTGAGSGIGRELILQFARLGYDIAAADINESQLDEAAAAVKAQSSAAIKTYRLNVSDEVSVNQFAQDVGSDFGRVDVVVNNAGITRIGEFMHTPQASFEAVMDVNFWGVVYGTRAFLPALISTQGTLVNISSIFGIIGVPGQTPYCASKFAVRGFTESLRQELKDTGIHIACVHPGGIRTNIARSAELDQSDLDKEAMVNMMEKKALKMPASEAASVIVKGVLKRKNRILIGADARVVDLVQRLFPKAYTAVLSMLGGKALVEPPKI